MMNNTVKKVIRASAGTGKTYRLSLEFIGLLLRFRPQNIHFSEILVITFTKKATAEIRERIFSQLRHIVSRTDEGHKLCQNIQDHLNIRVTRDDLDYLQKMYQDMLLNKNQVQISTIDSFIKKIFQTTIAPYLGITDFEIDDVMDEEWIGVILEALFKDANNLTALKEFFTRTNFKQIKQYTKLIEKIIESRWLFHFIEQWQASPIKQTQRPEDMQSHWQHFEELYGEVLEKIQIHINRNQIDAISKILVKDTIALFFEADEKQPAERIASAMKQKISDQKFVIKNYKQFLKSEKFWNDNLFRNETDLKQELKEKLRQARESLAEFIFTTELLKEEKEIVVLADLILNKYDEIKFREKIFSYNDIAFYTFKYLYNPDLSLIEHNSVSNRFYEILSAYTRFILIDEFQDTSMIQFKILLPIIMEVISGAGIKDYGGAVIVGDEKQSIYGWREGERDLLLKIPEILMEPEQTALTTSFRSRPLLLNFINGLFSHPHLHQQLHAVDIRWPYDAVLPPWQDDTGQTELQQEKADDQAGYVHVSFRNFSESGNIISHETEAIREFVENEIVSALNRRQISIRNTAILTRQNDDLNMIASILGEYGIPYVIESSLSVFKHAAVKPVLTLYDFLVYFDPLDLLAFLRSDLVLIHPVQLKQILLAFRDRDSQQHSILSLLSGLEHIPEIAKLLQVLQKSGVLTSDKADLLNITRIITEEYNIAGLFAQKNDIKNLHLFFEIIAGFMNNIREYSKDLKGFTQYCRDSEKNREFQQQGLTEIEAVKLLSIHKAKGLEFDSVFVYWNLSDRSGNSYGRMNAYIDYMPDYSGIRDCILTFNYDDVIPLCHAKSLEHKENIRSTIEQLNIFYVAVTRAKTNLFVFFSFKKAGGLPAFLKKDAKDLPDINHAVAATVLQVCQEEGVIDATDGNKVSAHFGALLPQPQQQAAAVPNDFSFIRKYLDTDRRPFLQKDQDRLSREAFLDFKTLYVRNRNTDRGNVAHYYLSFITYATPDERLCARNRSLGFFGSLLPVAEIESLISKLNRFIDKHPDIFSRDKWSKVFTEFTLFSAHGEVRLDRLMIDEKNKQVLIIDFKTGESYTQDQIHLYVQTLNSLPVVKNEGYQVRGEYVEVEI